MNRSNGLQPVEGPGGTPPVPRFCVFCGAQLEGRQKLRCARCRRKGTDTSRHKKGRRSSKGVSHAHKVTMMGIDGEGANDRYILLGASDERGNYSSVEHPEGLTTEECLEFLLSLPKGALKWGFAFSYDVNMILHDLPTGVLERLYRTNRCYWRDYRIEWIRGKKFMVSRKPPGAERAERVATVWDVFPWVTSSFASWLEDWNLAPRRVITRIRRMKDRRANFRASEMARIKAYNAEEVLYLAKGTRRLVELIRSQGKHLSAYYSPASLAKAYLRDEGVEACMDPRDDENRPVGIWAQLEAVFLAAYIGGRSEATQVGPIDGPLYHSDLRSAYPAAAVELPCLAHGHWRHWTTRRPSAMPPFTVARVSWTCANKAVWGPFPIRPSHGSNRWPTSGEAWVWWPEIEAAGHLCETLTVHEGWSWYPECDHRPFAYLARIFSERAQMKVDGDPAEYVLKLVLNSTYGALAEHEHPNADRAPKWRNLAWAGWITAKTRARLAEHLGPDCLLVATDSIVTRGPIDDPDPKALGHWDTEAVYDEMFVLGPGVYFGRKNGTWSTYRTRGFEPGTLTLEGAREAWERDGRTGVIPLTGRRFMGLGVAFARRRANGPPPFSTLWRTFVDVDFSKTFDMRPRRFWRNTRRHDGRSIAPTLEQHRRAEAEDEWDLIAAHLALEAYEEAGGEDPEGHWNAYMDVQALTHDPQRSNLPLDPEQPEYLLGD